MYAIAVEIAEVPLVMVVTLLKLWKERERERKRGTFFVSKSIHPFLLSFTQNLLKEIRALLLSCKNGIQYNLSLAKLTQRNTDIISVFWHALTPRTTTCPERISCLRDFSFLIALRYSLFFSPASITCL